MDDIAAPSAAALSFVLQLAQSRYKSTFKEILGFIQRVLANPLASPSYFLLPYFFADQHFPALISATTPQEKFGALAMVSALGGIILDAKSTFKDDIESFLGRFVVPELASPHPYLRHAVSQ